MSSAPDLQGLEVLHTRLEVLSPPLPALSSPLPVVSASVQICHISLEQIYSKALVFLLALGNLPI